MARKASWDAWSAQNPRNSLAWSTTTTEDDEAEDGDDALCSPVTTTAPGSPFGDLVLEPPPEPARTPPPLPPPSPPPVAAWWPRHWNDITIVPDRIDTPFFADCALNYLTPYEAVRSLATVSVAMKAVVRHVYYSSFLRAFPGLVRVLEAHCRCSRVTLTSLLAPLVPSASSPQPPNATASSSPTLTTCPSTAAAATPPAATRPARQTRKQRQRHQRTVARRVQRRVQHVPVVAPDDVIAARYFLHSFANLFLFGTEKRSSAKLLLALTQSMSVFKRALCRSILRCPNIAPEARVDACEDQCALFDRVLGCLWDLAVSAVRNVPDNTEEDDEEQEESVELAEEWWEDKVAKGEADAVQQQQRGSSSRPDRLSSATLKRGLLTLIFKAAGTAPSAPAQPNAVRHTVLWPAAVYTMLPELQAQAQASMRAHFLRWTEETCGEAILVHPKHREQVVTWLINAVWYLLRDNSCTSTCEHARGRLQALVELLAMPRESVLRHVLLPVLHRFLRVERATCRVEFGTEACFVHLYDCLRASLDGVGTRQRKRSEGCLGGFSNRLVHARWEVFRTRTNTRRLRLAHAWIFARSKPWCVALWTHEPLLSSSPTSTTSSSPVTPRGERCPITEPQPLSI